MREIHDAKVGDIEKANEDVMVYAYGEAGSSELTVYVLNRGADDVTVSRVWLNDDPQNESETVAPKASAELTIRCFIGGLPSQG